MLTFFMKFILTNFIKPDMFVTALETMKSNFLSISSALLWIILILDKFNDLEMSLTTLIFLILSLR